MLPSPYYISKSRRKEPGLRLAMGFFFGILAGLVIKDFMAHCYQVLDEHWNIENFAFMLCASLFLALQVLNGYLYYQYFEFHEEIGPHVSWRVYCGFLFDNAIEVGILFFCYGAAHEVDPKFIQPPSRTFSHDAAAGFFLNVFLVEALWLLWDVVYVVRRIQFRQSWWKQLKRFLSGKEVIIRTTRRWLILNTGWAIAMLIIYRLLAADRLNYTLGTGILSGALLLTYTISYLVAMKEYYSGQLALEMAPSANG